MVGRDPILLQRWVFSLVSLAPRICGPTVRNRVAYERDGHRLALGCLEALRAHDLLFGPRGSTQSGQQTKLR